MKQSRLHFLLLVSALSLLAIPACGDPEDPSTTDTTPPINTTPDDGCGTGRVRAAYMGGSQMCYASCTDDASCGTATNECKAADGANAPLICVPKATTPATCGEGEVRAGYRGGAAACYRTCTDDASCTGDNEICRAADAGAGMICVPGMVTGPCTVNTNFEGQMKGNDPADGGTFATSNDSYPEDAGVSAVWDYIEARKDELNALPRDNANTPVDEQLFVLPEEERLRVTGAVVIATSPWSRSQFGQIFFADKQRALRYVTSGTPPTMDVDGQELAIKVGDRISFTVTGVKLYSGTPQVGTMTDITVEDAASDEVYVIEKTGEDIDPVADYLKMVRVGGKVTSFRECGGSGKCFNLVHGEAMDKNVEVRTNSMYLDASSVGDCWTFVGPVNSFPGPFSTDMTAKIPQLESVKYEWLQTPRR